MAKKRGNKAKSAVKHAASAAPQAAKTAKVAKPNEPMEAYKLEAINAAMASAAVQKPVLTKLCRLCEAKDGPFLNIFDAEKILAKKINRLLPLVIDEYDTLPHKICFRCSAKVEDFEEFIDRCIRTQESLKRKLGESRSALARKQWEEKLKESKMSNDDYCESLIKKCVEKIGPVPDLPEMDSEPEPEEAEPLPVLESEPMTVVAPPVQKKGKQSKISLSKNELKIVPVSPVEEKQEKLFERKGIKSRLEEEKKKKEEPEKVYPVRSTRTRVEMRDSSPEDVEVLPLKGSAKKAETGKEIMPGNSLVGMVIREKGVKPTTQKKKKPPMEKEEEIVDVEELSVVEPKETPEKVEKPQPKRGSIKKTQQKVNGAQEKSIEKPVEESKEIITEETPEYDIMQHVCTIKVGGAGLLYQCKLCKRNFLKKEVVLGHNCARARQEIPKVNSSKPEPKPDVPKQVPMQRNPPKPTLSDKEIIEAFKVKTAQSLSINTFSMDTPTPVSRPKPGPASKKKSFPESSPLTNRISTPPQLTTQKQVIPPPSSYPSAVSTNVMSVEVSTSFPGPQNRYKLIPGSNNMYSCIEDTAMGGDSNVKKHAEVAKVQIAPKPQFTSRPVKLKKVAKPRPDDISMEHDQRNFSQGPSRISQIPHNQPPQYPPIYNNTYPNMSNQVYGQFPGYSQQQQPAIQETMPYPVGLFQTLPHTPAPQPVPFSTAAMQKQTYTVVQTGHPSKLLISTKQATPTPPLPPAPKARKGKKTPEVTKQPFQVTIEDSAPAKEQKEFFTFINVDPLLSPSYVLPTDNTIQEAQITTSTPASVKAVSKRGDTEVYTCELCHMEFSREKKLLAHLQTHYTKMDDNDDDMDRAPKKRTRKS